MKHHLQFVTGSKQQLLYREFPGPVHVFHASKKRSVQEHIPDGIDSVKMQQDGFPPADSLRHIKTGNIGKIIVHDFQGFQLIVPVIGILHPSVIQQILVYASRYGGGQKFPRSVDAHLPVLIQLLNLHPVPPSSCHGSSPFPLPHAAGPKGLSELLRKGTGL